MSRELKVGLFVGATLVVLAVFAFVVGDVAYFFKKPGYILNVDVATAAGLDAKAVVKMAGVKVGFVKGIVLAGRRAQVRLAVEAGVEVPKDSTATFAVLGLLGEKYVEISPGVSAEACRDEDVLPGAMSAGIDQVGPMLASLGEELKGAAASLRNALDAETLAKLRTALESAAGAADEVRGFLARNDADVRTAVRSATRAFDDVGARLGDAADDLARTLALLRDVAGENREVLKTDLAKIKDVAAEMEKALKLLNSTLERIDRGEGTVGKLVREPALFDQASSALRSVDKAAGGLAGLKPYADLEAAYLGTSESLRAILAAGVRTPSGAFAEAALVRDPRDERFSFSLQGGLRLGAFAPRAGFIESEFGLGLDLYGAGDRLRLSLEGFDFNRAESPRVRATARIFPARRVYLMAGVDDFSLAKRREFFLGLGVTLR
jgi:ABC-type transporter Mla subunit MlaD